MSVKDNSIYARLNPRVRRLGNFVLWGTAGVAGVIIMGSALYLLHHPNLNTDSELTIVLTFFILLVSLMNTAMIVYIALIMPIWQMKQAEELAEHKDDTLITAITELTQELKRRPTPNPSVVNFTLFGSKK